MEHQLYQVWLMWLFNDGVFISFWWGASFCACCILLGFPHHLTRLPKTHTHVHVLWTQS